MAVFRHTGFLFKNVSGVADTCFMPSDSAKVREDSLEMLKERENQNIKDTVGVGMEVPTFVLEPATSHC